MFPDREELIGERSVCPHVSLLQRYARQLDQQEDRLSALQKEMSDLNERKDKADEELDQTIQAIVMDESL